jgi:signal peptidase I
VVAFASIIPGLGHWLVGDSVLKAAALFCAYAGLLIWASLFSGLGAWLSTTILFSYHQWLFTDCSTRARAQLGLPRRRGRELMTFALMTALTLGLVYRQAGRTIARFGAAVVLDSDLFEPRFSRGDRLLITRQSAFRRGDAVYSAAYGGLERVVGMPGDDIAITDAILRVNGQTLPPGQGPFSNDALRRIGSGRVVVPPDRYLVFFPSRSRYLGGDRLLGYFLIRKDVLDGRVVARYSPEYTRFP